MTPRGRKSKPQRHAGHRDADFNFEPKNGDSMRAPRLPPLAASERLEYAHLVYRAARHVSVRDPGSTVARDIARGLIALSAWLWPAEPDDDELQPKEKTNGR